MIVNIQKMELFLLTEYLHPGKINEIHDKIKHLLMNFNKLSKSMNRSHYELPGVNYFIESGIYRNRFFFVIMTMDHEYLFSIGNMMDSFVGMEFYCGNDEPYLVIPFPEELSTDAYFNLSTVHDLKNVSLEFMIDSKELYNKLEICIGHKTII